MSTMSSQITSVSIVYLSICSGPDQRKHQSSVSLAFVRGIHRWPVNSPHKGPVMRKMFSFDESSWKFHTFWHHRLVNRHTARCCYNAVNFLIKIHKRHPIVHPNGRAMGCLLWIQHLTDILPQFLFIYVTSHNIGLSYTGTQLYLDQNNHGHWLEYYKTWKAAKKRFVYIVSNFFKVYFSRSSSKHISIDLGNGLAPNRCQTIT